MPPLFTWVAGLHCSQHLQSCFTHSTTSIQQVYTLEENMVEVAQWKRMWDGGGGGGGGGDNNKNIVHEYFKNNV